MTFKTYLQVFCGDFWDISTINLPPDKKMLLLYPFRRLLEYIKHMAFNTLLDILRYVFKKKSCTREKSISYFFIDRD